MLDLISDDFRTSSGLRSSDAIKCLMSKRPLGGAGGGKVLGWRTSTRCRLGLEGEVVRGMEEVTGSW